VRRSSQLACIIFLSSVSQFLRGVVAELSKYPEIGPGIIGRVTAAAQRRYFDPPEFHSGGGKYR
jgi:hypothetical protein